MRPGFGSHVGLLETIGCGFRSSQDPRRVRHLSQQTKTDCKDLYTKATINQFILVARNYPVAIVSILRLCQTVVNGLDKAAHCSTIPENVSQKSIRDTRRALTI